MSTSNNTVLGGGGFHHVAIRARDFDRTCAFYKQYLGFLPRIEWGEAPKRAVMLDTGDGNYLEVFERPEQDWADSDAAILHMAIRTTKLDEVLESVRKAGCEVTMEPRTLTIDGRPDPAEVRIAFFKGPDGEIIELFQNDAL